MSGSHLGGASKELKRDIKTGKLVPLERMKERDIARINIVRSGLMAFPRRMAQELQGLDMRAAEELMMKRCRELLEGFASA